MIQLNAELYHLIQIIIIWLNNGQCGYLSGMECNWYNNVKKEKIHYLQDLHYSVAQC